MDYFESVAEENLLIDWQGYFFVLSILRRHYRAHLLLFRDSNYERWFLSVLFYRVCWESVEIKSDSTIAR